MNQEQSNLYQRQICLGIDILDRPQRTGIDRYYDELLKHLPQIATDFNFSTFTLQPPKSGQKQNGMPLKAVSHSNRLANLKSLFGYLPKVDLAFPEADLVHLLMPFSVHTNKAILTTVYDLTPFLDITSATYPWYMRMMLKLNLRRLISTGSHFTVISDCTGRDLARLFNVPSERIHRIYLGVDDRFRATIDKDEIQATAKRYGLPAGYFLFIGAMNRRKNLTMLLDAYARFVAKSNNQIGLVIAGRTNWGGEDTEKQIKALGLEPYVVFPGYIDEDDLPTVISGATALVYPSLYEGFGLPTLEAMACSIPIITTTSGALPETTGGHALLCEHHDSDQFATEMLRITNDNNLRNNLIRRGRDWSNNFRWEKTATETVNLYNHILHNNR